MKTNKKLLGLLVVAMSAVAAIAGPFDAWLSYKTIVVTPTTITTPIQAQTNFPLLVRLTSASVAAGSDVLSGSLTSGGLDIRFTDSTGTTSLNFERVRWTAANDSAEFWVLLPQIRGTGLTTKIRVYYGKAAQSNASNSANVFDTTSVSNGFRAVYHMEGANSSADEVDATANHLDATVFGTPAAKALGGLGYARNLTAAPQSFLIGGTQTNRGVFFTDANNGYAVGLSGLARKTTDGGASWTSNTTGALRGGTATVQLQLNSVSCPASNTCFAAGGTNTTTATRYIAKTSNGTTWAKSDSSTATSTMLNGISCPSATRCVAVGGNGTTTQMIDTTINGGTAWGGTSNSTGKISLNAVHCPSTTICFAGGGTTATVGLRYILKSTNGGFSFAKTDSSTTSSRSGTIKGIHCPTTSVCYAVGFGGVIDTTKNGGTNWGLDSNGGANWTTNNLNSVFCTDASTCWAVGTASTFGGGSVILKTSNGGTSWASQTVPNSMSDSLYSVYFTDANNGVVVGANGLVLRTSDGGTNWNLNLNSRALAYSVNTSLNVGDNYTNSAWISPSSNPGTQMTIMGKGDDHWNLQARSSKLEATEVNYSTGTGNSYSSPPYGTVRYENASQGTNFTSGAGVWHYAVGVRVNNTEGGTVTANVESLYVDGGPKSGGTSVVCANSCSGSTSNDGNTGGFRFLDAVTIGRQTNVVQNYWTLGSIDEVTSAAVRRSEDWIALSYQTQSPTQTAVTQSATTTNLPLITVQPKDTIVLTGTAGSLFVTSTSPSSRAYQWFKGASPVSAGGNVSLSAAGDTLYFASVTAADTSSAYSVQITNSAGTTTSAVAKVVLAVVPVVSYSSPLNLVANQPATVTPTLTGNPASCTASPTLPLGLTINNQTCVISGTPTKVKAATVYTVLASNAAGNNNPGVTFTLAVYDTFVVIATQPVSKKLQAVGDTAVKIAVTLTNMGGDTTITYKWVRTLKGGQVDTVRSVVNSALLTDTLRLDSNITSAGDSSRYVCVVKNAAGNVTTSTDTLLVAPKITYSVNPVIYLRGLPITPNTVTNTGGAIASCAAPGAFTTNTSLLFSTTDCSITGTAIVAGAVGANYTITATGPGGTGNVLLNAAVAIPPTITAQPTNAAVKVAANAKFKVTGTTGFAPLTYKWVRSPFGAIDTVRTVTGTTSTSDSLTITNVQAAHDSLLYKVVISNVDSTIISNVDTLFVAPKITFAQSAYLLSTAAGGGITNANNGGHLKAVNAFTTSPILPSAWILDSTTGAITVPIGASSFFGTKRYTLVALGSGPINDTAQVTIAVGEGYSAWAKHRTIGINTSATLAGAATTTGISNFPLLVRLDSTNFDFTQPADSNGADVRFTKSDDQTPLVHQIETWSAGAKTAAVWVLMDTVAGNNVTQTIRMHWSKGSVANVSNGPAVFDNTNGYQGVWHLNEPSGDISDATANGVSGVNNGTVTTSGMVGAARVFNPILATTNNYIDLGNPVAFNNAMLSGNRTTIEAWAKTDTNTTAVGANGGSGFRTIISHFDDVIARLSPNTTTPTIAAPRWEYGYNGNQRVVSNIGSDMHVWTHLVAINNNGTWSFFRNGVSAGTVNGTSSSVTATNTAPITWLIGSWWGNGNCTSAAAPCRSFTGGLDEIRLSNTTRTSDYAKLSYASQVVGQTAVVMPLDSIKYPTAIADTAGVVAPTVTPGVYGTASSFSVISGSLPSGLSLNAVTGVITGTPSVSSSGTGGTFPITIRAVNSLGSSALSSFTLTVASVAPIITTQPTALLKSKVGGAVKFSVVVNSGGSSVFYQWSRNGGPFNIVGTTGGLATTSTSDTLILNNVSSADTGLYQVKISNASNSQLNISSNIDTLRVAPRPVFSAGSYVFTSASGGAVTAPSNSATAGVLNSPKPYSFFPALTTGVTFDSTTGILTVAAAATPSGLVRYGIVATGPGGSDTSYIGLAVSEDFSTWTNQRNIRINTTASSGGAGTTAGQAFFPMLVRLDSTNFNFLEADSATGADLRFTKADGTTPLSFQIETWSRNNKNATAWVLLDTVAGNNSSQSFKMLWGKSGATNRSVASAVFSTGNNFQGVWHMNQGGTGNEADATQNGFLGTVQGTAPTSFNSPMGLGRSFGGAGAFRMSSPSTVNGALNFAQGAPWTISAWVLNNATPAQRVILGKSDNQFHFQLTTTTIEGVEFENAVGWRSVNTPPTTNVWTHVVFVHNGSGATVADSLYVNGAAAITTTSLATSTATRTVDRDVVIGGLPGSAPSGGTFTRFWSGFMDEVEVSNNLRSADWNKLSYATQVAGQTAVVLQLDSLVYSAAPSYAAGTAITLTPAIYGTAATFSVITGTLPVGLTLNAATGVISGTPTVAGSGSVTIQATNSLGNTVTNSISFTVTSSILTSLGYSPPVATFEIGQAITPVTATLTPPSTPVTYTISDSLSITNASLFASATGLSFNASTGAISGTPNATLATKVFYITADNGTVPVAVGTFTLTIQTSESYTGTFKDFLLNTTASAAGVTTTQSRIPVLIRLSSAHLPIFQQAALGGADIRFASGTGQHLPYQIERWSFAPGDTSAAIWVQADSVGASGTTPVRMYWNTGLASSRSNGTSVFSNGNLGVWHLGEAQDSNAIDASPYGFNGKPANTGFGNPLDTLGAIGQGKSFRGQTGTTGGFFVIDSARTITGVTDFAPGSTFSISSWVRSYSSTISGCIIGKGEAHYYLGKRNGGANWEIMNNNGTQDLGVSQAMVGTANVWKHVVGVISGSTGAIYVNGALVSSTISNIATTARVTGFPLTIGRDPSSLATRYITAALDEVTLSNVARSADWAKLSYFNQKPGVTPITDLSYGSAFIDSVGKVTTHTPTVFGVPTRWTISPTLPKGLSFSTSTGVISGTPADSASAVQAYTVTAFGDSVWSSTATFNLSTVNYKPVLSYALAPVMEVGTPIITALPAVTINGGPVSSYSVSPDLTAATGLSFNTTTGAISGTPSSAISSTPFTFKAINSFGSDSLVLNLTVLASENYTGGSWPNNATLTLNTANVGGGNVLTSQSNFPVLVRLTSKHLSVFQQSKSDGSDIRFTNFSGQHLPFEIERWSFVPGDTSAAVWVTVNSITGNGTTNVKMYWGNNSAPVRSNGPSVFNPANGYLAVWHLNDAVGAPAVDATGLGHTATPGFVIGSGGFNPTDTAGAVGRAKRFSGLGTTLGSYYLATLGTGATSLNLNTDKGPYTISAWANPTSCAGGTAATRGTIISKYDAVAANNTKMWFLGVASANNLWRAVDDPPSLAGNVAGNEYSVDGTCTAGAWQNVATTYSFNGTPAVASTAMAGSEVIYVNGTGTTGTSITGNKALTGTVVDTANVYIARTNDAGGSSRFFQGGIDEVSISRVARSADWVKLGFVNQNTNVAPLFNNAAYVTAAPVLNTGILMTPDTLTVTGTFTTCSVVPTLPSGLTLSSACIISGTPALTSPSTNYTVTALNGSWSASTTVNITVQGVPLSLSYPSSPTYEVSTAILPLSPTLSSAASVTYSVSPALPSGLSINASSGIISGNPSAVSAVTSYTVTATVSGVGSVSTTITLSVQAAETYSPAAWSNSISMTLSTGTTGAGVSTSQSNFPVLVRLNSKHLSVFQQAKSDGSDIRFTNNVGDHLPYQIERWSFAPGDTSAAIWVKADNIVNNGNTTLKMLWGNPGASSRSNPGAVFEAANGYQSVWHLGDAVGPTARPNAVAGGNVALPTNFPTNYVPRTGVIGLADTLRGGPGGGSASDYLDLGNGYKSWSTGFTYSVWANPKSTLSFQRLFETGNATNGNDNISFFRSNGTAAGDLRFESLSGTTSGGLATAPGVLVSNVWAQYSVTVNGTAVQIYKNGAAVSSMTLSGNATGLSGMARTIKDTTRANAYLGRSNYPSDSAYTGMYDEPQLSTVARSADWLMLSYKNQKIDVGPVFSVAYAQPSVTLKTGDTLAPNLATAVGAASRYVLASGSLPIGLTLDTNTGTISGVPTQAGVFTPTVSAFSDSLWFATSSALNITVNAPPVITSQPLNTAAVQGTSAKFGVTVTGTTPLVYTLLHTHGVVTDTLKRDTLSVLTDTLSALSVVTVDSIGTYNILVTNVAGSALSDTAVLKVVTTPAANPPAQAFFGSVNVALSTTSGAAIRFTTDGSTPTGSSTLYATPLAFSATTTLKAIAILGSLQSSELSATYTLSNVGTPIAAPASRAFVDSIRVALSALPPDAVIRYTTDGTTPDTTTSAIYTDSITIKTTKTLKAVAVKNGAISSVSSDLYTLNAPPTINTQPHDTTVASGTTASFTVAASVGTGTLSYQWKRNGVNVVDSVNHISGATNPTLGFILSKGAVITDTGSYNVVVTNTVGITTTSVTSTASKLFVNVPPAITLQPRDTTVISGATPLFAAAATGSGAISYQWMRNGSPVSNAASHISGATSDTLKFIGVTGAVIADTGSYTVVATNTLNGNAVTTTSSVGKLAIVTAPTITVQPHDTVVANGALTNFNVKATVPAGALSAGVVTYQWRKGIASPVNVANVSQHISGATLDTLKFITTTGAVSADSGSYSAVITNTLNGVSASSTSGFGNLSINEAPNITTAPHDTTVIAGGTANFSVTATAIGALTYQWRKVTSSGSTAVVDAANHISGAATSTLNFIGTSGALLADTGSYTVTIISSLNGSTSQTVSTAKKLFVVTAPTITVQPRDTTVVAGVVTNFRVTATIPGGNTNIPAGAISFQWKRNGVNVVDSVTHISGATVSLAQGVLTGSDTLRFITTIGARITDTGSYTVDVKNTINGVVNTSTSNVGKLAVNVAPVITTQPHDTTVVSGSTASFSVAATNISGALTYQWKRNGTNVTDAANHISGATTTTLNFITTTGAVLADTGSYTVTVTNTLTGTTTSTTSAAGKLVVNAPPTITTQPHDTTVVSGSVTAFTVAATNIGGTLSYQWKKNGVNVVDSATHISGATTATLSFISTVGAVIGDTGSYTVVVTNTLSSSAMSTTSNVGKLAVNVAPVITTQPHDTTVISGSAASFVVAAGSPVGVLSYQWKKGAVNVVDSVTHISGSTAASLAFIPTVGAIASDTGSYTVVVTNTLNGTTTTATSTIGKLIVNVPPAIVSSPANKFVPGPGIPVKFGVTVTGTLPMRYVWVHTYGASADTVRRDTLSALTDTLTLATVVPADSGAYKCVVSNVAGTVVSAAGTLSGSPPAIVTQPVAGTATAGLPKKIAVTVTGTTPLVYTWIHSYGAVTDTLRRDTLSVFTDTLTLASVAVADTGLYKVRVTNVIASIVSDTSRLKVQVPPTITTQPVGLSLFVNDNATYVVKVAGDAPFTYQWIRTNKNGSTDTLVNGTGIAGATKDTLILSAVQLTADSTTYKCRITNVAGTVISSPALLNVTGIVALSRVIRVTHSGGLFNIRMPQYITGVHMTIQDMRGHVVWSHDFRKEKDANDFKWDGVGSNGRLVSSGMYVVRMKLFDTQGKSAGEIKKGVDLSH